MLVGTCSGSQQLEFLLSLQHTPRQYQRQCQDRVTMIKHLHTCSLLEKEHGGEKRL